VATQEWYQFWGTQDWRNESKLAYFNKHVVGLSNGVWRLDPEEWQGRSGKVGGTV